MSHILLVLLYSTLLGKFCHLALMIAINVSVAIWQLPIRQFCSFAKWFNEMNFFSSFENLKLIPSPCLKQNHALLDSILRLSNDNLVTNKRNLGLLM